MSDLSPRLDLPFILPAQAQKHVTHNEALSRLDALVQLVVLARESEIPPDSPTPGDIYALGAAPAGLWAGQAHDLAIWQDPNWLFLTPRPGWQLWDQDSQQMYIWADGWQPLPCHHTPRIGVSTQADATNRLAVAADATLFTHAGAGHQMKLNKASAGETTSLLFQTGFSTRAELGLAGNDDLSLKLSTDGSSFSDALVLSGQAAAPRLRLSQPDSSGDLFLMEAAGQSQFRLTAAGDAHAAGSWQSGGADYAEFFEWHDGNPDGEDRRGISVVLEGEKIRPAQAGEDPIGVISTRPALVGDADMGHWPGKYLRDAYGSPTDVIAPDFDPNKTYIPRQQRPEWAIVGLLGKLNLRTGQPTGERWQQLRSEKDGLERWLLR